MDVASQLLPPRVVLHHDRFETALEQVPDASVPSVEPDAVTDVEPLHRTAQVGFRGLDQQVKMIVHQHIYL